MPVLPRPVLLTLALFALGAPLRGGAWPSWLLVLTFVLLVLDDVRPAAYVARAPRWLARPWLGLTAGAVLLLHALGPELTVGQVLWLAGTGVFLHDAWRRGEPQHLAAALRVASAASAPQPAGGGSRRRVLVALGLFAAAFLTSGIGEVPGAPRLGLVWLVVTALLLVDTFAPARAAALPAPLRRPVLGAAATGVNALLAASVASFTPAFLLFVAGTAVLAADTAARGELGPFDPRLLGRGWGRRVAVAGVLWAAMSLSQPWDNAYSTPGYSTTRSSTDYGYNSAGDYVATTTRTTEWTPASNFGGATTAWTYGDGLPALGLLALLALLCWRGPGHPVLARVAPLALLAPLGLWALSHLVENHRIAAGFANSWGNTSEAFGPWSFLFGLAIGGAGVLLQGRREAAPALPVGPAVDPAVG